MGGLKPWAAGSIVIWVLIACENDESASRAPWAAECEIDCSCDSSFSCDERCSCDPECGCEWVPFCDVDRRFGLYRISYSELSGSCGPIPTEDVFLGGTDDGSGSGADCDVSQRVTDKGCTLVSSATCRFADGLVMVIEGESRQIDGSAGRLRGTTTIKMTKGLSRCRSTYSASFRRLSL